MPTMLCDTCGGEFTWDLSTAFDRALAVSKAEGICFSPKDPSGLAS